MENHKLDRLFQDKLSRHEVGPSPQAWEAINAELKNDNKPMVWLSVAASVALVATIGWLMLRNDREAIQSSELAYQPIENPMPQPTYDWNLPLPAEKQSEQKVAVKRVGNKQLPVVNKVPMNETLAQQTTEMASEEFMPEIESIGMDAMASLSEEEEAVEELDTRPIQTLPGVGVQITYKATPPVQVDEKSRIERLWAKAKEIKPGDVLADLRETKNDFFNGKRN